MPKLDATVTKEAAFNVISKYPYRDSLERVKHLRATFTGLDLFPAVGFVEAFDKEGFPMQVEFIADSPKRRSPTFPKLAGFEFPDQLALGYHQKDLKAAAGHLAGKLEVLDLHVDAPDPMCATPGAILQAEMVKLLRSWSAAL